MNSQSLSQWHASPSKAAPSPHAAPPTGQQVFSNQGYGTFSFKPPQLLWWLILTVHLTNLWAYLWWLVYIRLTEKGRPTADVSGTIPWPGVPHWTGESKLRQASLAFCCLSADAVGQAALGTYDHDFSTIRDHTLDLCTNYNPPYLGCLCQALYHSKDN